MPEHISFAIFHPKPLLVVISGPSGVGKDSALISLKARQLPLHFVVTATTRKIRPGEVDGVDYFFYDRAKFEDMIAKNELLEWAVVYQDYKGIPKEQIRQAMNSGKDVIMRVDVQGAATIRRLCPEAVLIFLTPANEEEWLERLKARKTETPDSLAVRTATARDELTHVHEFDYVVVNSEGRLEQAVDTIVRIIDAEHHKVQHRTITL
ncbi:MAG TPA: guanylate kinase [Anaerolineaceae bacterium]|nr:guanylate kinase [Anaerolineaceae bacterium]HPN52687.1 guanylate kinase [Anaerolineaceae bacterium]